MPVTSSRRAPAGQTTLEVPSLHNWRTTDEDEINRRRWRAQNESFTITNQDSRLR